MTRGIRNNNPLNIRKNPANHWLGAIKGDDKEFEKFYDIQFGIRAAFLIIKTYLRRDPELTPAKIIENWAPRTENNTTSYIKAVRQSTGIDMEAVIKWDYKQELCKLLHAMAIVENSAAYEIYFPTEMFYAIYDALNESKKG